MKYMTYFLFFFSFYTHGQEKMKLTELSSLKWENRIILVKVETNKDNILNLFEENKGAINERDIVWFIMQGDTIDTNYKAILDEKLVSNISHQYTNQPGNVLLIGKDGRIKSSRESVDLESVFLEIDAMPMRQSEMNNQ
ncbi:DUF4174 domain-containing protein [Psychromonas sp. KJ10-10]|uniref:DUF4174 domain-containing protein n=1 Tax=Psychromonas sp. KJ10-10 TaxID=3391823 RepID=UPI0039B67DA1